MNILTQQQTVNKRDLIESLIKGLDVIKAFSSYNPHLTISEVAHEAGLSRAAARRYLLTLVHLGLAVPDRFGFRLTSKVAELGLHLRTTQAQPPMHTPSHPLIERLTQELQGSGNVAVVLLDRADTAGAGIAVPSR